MKTIDPQITADNNPVMAEKRFFPVKIIKTRTPLPNNRHCYSPEERLLTVTYVFLFGILVWKCGLIEYGTIGRYNL